MFKIKFRFVKQLHILIIYFPSGTHDIYTTSPEVAAADSNYELAISIKAKPGFVKVVTEDGTKTYSGMPYEIESW